MNSRFCFVILLFNLALLFSVQNFAQNPMDTPFVIKKQIQISFSPVVYSKVSIDNQGEKILSAKNILSGVFSLGYRQNIIHQWNANIDLSISEVAQKVQIPYEIIFDTVTNTAQLGGKFKFINDNRYVPVATLSLSIDKWFATNKKYIFYSLQTGVGLSRLLNYPYNERVGFGFKDSILVFDYNIKSEYLQVVNGFVKFGIAKVTSVKEVYLGNELKKRTKGQNTIQVNIVFNYSLQSILRGEYEFYHFSFKSSGTTRLNMNYVGVEFKWGITLSKK